jgi:tetratricopeptide (TPR) repeat protein
MTLFMIACLSTPTHAHSDDVMALHQRIEELYRAGKYSEAAPIAERALKLTRAQQGEDHIDTASRMIWLGTIYRDQGRYPEAEPLYKRSLAIREKALGPDHPHVGIALNSLAGLYRAEGRYAEAERPTSARLPSWRRHWGPTTPTSGNPSHRNEHAWGC